METIELRNQVTIPLLWFGVFQITDAAMCEQAVTEALKTGYRLLDTAACYGNERAVGNAVRNSGIRREDIFLVSKVWIQDAGYEQTKRSFYKSLENLQTDYLDLYLVHMPYGDYHGSWRAMEELYEEGRIKAIGVCNFLPDRLTDLSYRTHGQSDRTASLLSTDGTSESDDSVSNSTDGMGPLCRRTKSDLYQSTFNRNRSNLWKDTSTGHFALASAKQDRSNSKVRACRAYQ